MPLTNSQAADVLKRKSGLWEMTSKASGEPDSISEICVDQTIDNPQALLFPDEDGCRVVSFQHFGNEAVGRFVCEDKKHGATATINVKFNGDFNSAYKGTLKMLFDPPMYGQRERTVTTEAKWIRSCSK